MLNARSNSVVVLSSTAARPHSNKSELEDVNHENAPGTLTHNYPHVEIRNFRALVSFTGVRALEDTFKLQLPGPRRGGSKGLNGCHGLEARGLIIAALPNLNENKPRWREIVTHSHTLVTFSLVSLCRIVSHHVASHRHGTTCVSVLLQLDDHDEQDDVERNAPLAVYGAEYWVRHAQFEDIASHIKGMEHLFDVDSPYFAAWRWLHDIDVSSAPGSVFHSFTHSKGWFGSCRYLHNSTQLSMYP
jgi:hypothetical protein